jgi:hypothetical protein
MPNNELIFFAFLNQNDDDAWQQVVSTLAPSIHPVDGLARIWFGSAHSNCIARLQTRTIPADGGELLMKASTAWRIR